MRYLSSILLASLLLLLACRTAQVDKRGQTIRVKKSEPTAPDFTPPVLDPDAPQLNCPHTQGREVMIGIVEAQKRWLKNGVLLIPAGQTVLVNATDARMVDGVAQFQIPRIEIEATARLIFDDIPLHLKVKDIMVSGAFMMGSPSCRLEAASTIEFYNDANEDLNLVYNRSGKGIMVMPQGLIDVHGKLYYQSWTRLAATAAAGATEILLQQAVNWEVGQKIVVVSSAMRDYPYEQQNEVLTIAGVKDKTLVQLTEKLKFTHYAGAEYQVEVALLSRRIKFTSSPDQAADAKRFGGHVMVMGEGRIAGVELTRMGQQNLRGRYPLHFHLAGDLKTRPSYMTDNSVWQSHWRCITLHGTHHVQISRNVGYDVFGHCYYMEDGVEEGNELSYNLAARVKIMGPVDEASLRAMNTGAQEGFTQLETPNLTQPSDRAAAGFYITNANNRFIGNAASGGFAGFTFPNLPRAIGESRSVKGALIPKDVPLKESTFQGNTAHTAGYFWEQSGCIYLGGLLTEFTENGIVKLRYQSGRPDHANIRRGRDVFSYTKTFLCEVGIAHWGGFAELHNFESFDSGKLAVLFGDSLIKNSLFNAETANRAGQKYKPLAGYARGFQFYDTASRTIIKNLTFQNIKRLANGSGQRSQNNCAFYNMTHSDEFTPEFMSIVAGIRYINVDPSQMICHDSRDTLASRNFNFVDADGTATGESGPVIVGSGDIDFWKSQSACKRNQEWGVWVCPKANSREVASVQIKLDESGPLSVSLWGVNSNGGRNYYPAQRYERQHFSGPSASGWHVGFNSVPNQMRVQLKNLGDASWLVLSFAMPRQNKCWVDNWGAVGSFEALRASTRNSYWVDAQNGYCMLKVMGYKTAKSFDREGLSLPEITSGDVTKSFVVKTDCNKGMCTDRSAQLPSPTL